MREIKFRSFGKKGMIYAILSKNSYVNDFVIMGRNGLQISNSNLMQYTGLKDKNGKEIYEGDIVKDLTNYYDLFETPGLFEDNKVLCLLKVYWCVGEAQFRMKNDKLHYHDQISHRRLEVMGNIYENPELLEKIR